MTVHPYNLDAVALIRAQAKKGLAAVSALLGWDEAMTLRVARRHSVDLPAVGASAPKPPEPEPIPAATAVGTPTKWEPQSRTVATARGKVVLSVRDAQIFAELWRSPERITGRQICKLLGIVNGSAGGYVTALRNKLARVGLKVDGAMGPDGSYRLVAADTGLPTVPAYGPRVSTETGAADSSKRNPRSPAFPQVLE